MASGDGREADVGLGGAVRVRHIEERVVDIQRCGVSAEAGDAYGGGVGARANLR